MSDYHESAYAIYHEWKDWSVESFGVASQELDAAYKALLRKHVQIEGRYAIDFGFGNGEMLTILRATGFQSIGIELNPVLCEIASSKGYETVGSLTDDRLPCSCSVTVITAFHVLEHLDKDTLRQTFARFAILLKRGGIVIAAFPNGDSPFAASAFNGDITHVTCIGSSMADQVGSMSGLKLTSFHAFPALTTYSLRPLVRLKGLLRCYAEQIISGLLSRVYYGNADKVLSPVAVAVWTKA
jgi:hypothetical protein